MYVFEEIRLQDSYSFRRVYLLLAVPPEEVGYRLFVCQRAGRRGWQTDHQRNLGDVVDGKRKAELLRLIAQVEKVDIAQTIAVGDGANDLPIMGIAGPKAFHAKPKVVANAAIHQLCIGLEGYFAP